MKKKLIIHVDKNHPILIEGLKSLKFSELKSRGEADKKLAEHIQNSEVEIIENCGHMILLEEAGQSLEILKKFIRKNHPA